MCVNETQNQNDVEEILVVSGRNVTAERSIEQVTLWMKGSSASLGGYPQIA